MAGSASMQMSQVTDYARTIISDPIKKTFEASDENDTLAQTKPGEHVEVKYIIRPQNIKIAQITTKQYGWLKAGFRFIFVMSIFMVILGSPLMGDWSGIVYHTDQFSATTKQVAVNRTCYGKICPSKDGSVYSVTTAKYTACQTNSESNPHGPICKTSNYGTEKVANKRSCTRCRFICREDLDDKEKDYCTSNLYPKDNRYHAAGMVVFRSLALTVKWSNNDEPQNYTTGMGSLGIYQPEAYRGNMLFMLWKDTGIEWWTLEVGIWNQVEAKMLDYLEIQCEAYRNSRVDAMFAVLALCFSVGFLWAFWRMAMKALRHSKRMEREETIKASRDHKVVFSYLSDGKMNYLRNHSSLCFIITTVYVFASGFYYYADTFGAKSFFYILRSATLWGLAFCALRVPNHPDLKEKWTWINWLALLTAACSFGLSVFIWAKYASELWDSPLKLANADFDAKNHLQWHGWLQLFRYIAGAMFGLLVFTRPFLIHDDDAQNPDYMQSRVWVVARTSYWQDCTRTFVLVGIASMVTELAQKNDPWWSFLYWFQSADLVSESIMSFLIWLFGVALALLYYPYRTSTRDVSAGDIAHSSFSSQNTSKLLEVSSNPEHDLLLKNNPLNQIFISSCAISEAMEKKSDLTDQILQKVKVTAKFNKRYGSVSIDISGVNPMWDVVKTTVVAVSQTSQQPHAVSDAIRSCSGCSSLNFVVPNNKLLHGPFYRFKVAFFFENGMAIDSSLSGAPGIVVPEMKTFSATEARELARISSLVYDDDMLTAEEQEAIELETQQNLDRVDSNGRARFVSVKSNVEDEVETHIIKTVFEPRDSMTKVNRSPNTTLLAVFCDYMDSLAEYESTDSHACLFVRKRGSRLFHEVLDTMQRSWATIDGERKRNPKKALLCALWNGPLDKSVLDILTPLKFDTIHELGVAVLTLVNPSLIPHIHKNSEEHSEEKHSEDKNSKEQAEFVKDRAGRFRDICFKRSPDGELWQILTAAMETVHPARIVKIIVAFRGTASTVNVKTDVNSAQIPYPDHGERQRVWEETNHKIYVHQGFHKALISLHNPASVGCPVPENGTLMEQLKGVIQSEINTWGTPPSLTVSGHSLGGAIATIFSMECALDDKLHHVPLECITFGQPRVMNVSGALFINEVLPHYWRIVNEGDPVPEIPKILAAQAWAGHACVIPHVYMGRRRYKHAGRKIVMKESGMMILPQSPLEGDSAPNPVAHFMSKYERALELYLLHRRQWLWRKATTVLRAVVRIRLSTTAHGITVPEMHRGQDPPPNDNKDPPVLEECLRWKETGHCNSFAIRGKCCFLHKQQGAFAIPTMDNRTNDEQAGMLLVAEQVTNPLHSSPKSTDKTIPKLDLADFEAEPEPMKSTDKTVPKLDQADFEAEPEPMSETLRGIKAAASPRVHAFSSKGAASPRSPKGASSPKHDEDEKINQTMVI